MGNYDGATIEIVNWEKYNPKRDQKSYTWLRLDNSISTDPDLFGLDAEQKYVWIEVLCQASKKNSPKVKLNLGYLEHITGVKKTKIVTLLDFLLEKPMINVHDNSRPHTVAACSESPTVTTPTNERTDERTNDVCTEAENNSASGAISEFSEDLEIEALLKPIKQSTQMRWIKLYSDPQWIRSEFLKAIGWLEANPQKAPKRRLDRFLGGWLSRGWEQYRRSIRSAIPNSINTQPINPEDLQL